MRTGAAAMFEQIGVGAAGLIEGVGQDRATYKSEFTYDRHEGIPVLRSKHTATSAPDGSRGAMRWFREYLDERPEDYGVRWLLNVASSAWSRRNPMRSLSSQSASSSWFAGTVSK